MTDKEWADLYRDWARKELDVRGGPITKVEFDMENRGFAGSDVTPPDFDPAVVVRVHCNHAYTVQEFPYDNATELIQSITQFAITRTAEGVHGSYRRASRRRASQGR